MVELVGDLSLVFLIFGDDLAQRIDEIAENVADFLEVGGNEGFFLLPQLGDELAQTLPVAFGERAGVGVVGGPWVGRTDQDMPGPLLAEFVDGLRAVLIEIEGVFAQNAQQPRGGIQRGIALRRRFGVCRSRFIRRFFIGFLSKEHKYPAKRTAKSA
ncbi:MAG: hypothetical protein IPI57_18920 [Candidatus Competibacteraceae bacterium]|nr:hypothetical protein [Candidatus Competibacteraceae bacterium]